jgi:adenine-specific DNA methylase
MLERLLDGVRECSANPAVVRALSMAVVGSAEMAGHLSRWDRYYLKSYEAMAGHRFNLTTLAVEPNVWGTVTSGRGTVLRRMTQLVKAASWLRERAGPVEARVVEGSSERLLLDDASVDLVLTDPPYHDDVQYSELSLPLRAWADLSDGHLAGEAVVGRVTGDDQYGPLLARIFTEARRALRPGGHLIFSYANRSPEAWVALFASLQRAGFRALGCEIVHSENETDQAKRGIRACTLDLILDLVPAGDVPLTWHGPRVTGNSDEIVFLRLVAATFADVGSLTGRWRQRFVQELNKTRVLGREP